jgi:hypothetical protein
MDTIGTLLGLVVASITAGLLYFWRFRVLVKKEIKSARKDNELADYERADLVRRMMQDAASKDLGDSDDAINERLRQYGALRADSTKNPNGAGDAGKNKN